jgi:hypothetical protein
MLKFLSDAYAFALAHGPAGVTLLLVLIPSLITGLSEYPKAASFVSFLKVLLNLLSVLSHRDSPGTFKLPFTFSQAPAVLGSNVVGLKSSAKGFATLYVLIAIAIGALVALAMPAHAADAPTGGTLADVAPSDPPPSSMFGGCLKSGKVCFSPSVSITIAALNFSTKKIEGAFSPGVGYGFTAYPGQWYSVGADAYFTLDPGAQQASISLLGKFLNGYFRVGPSKGFIGDTSWRLLFGSGVNVPL